VTIAQRIDKERKRGRRLPPAGVIEVIPRPSRAPFVKHPDQATVLQVRLRQILWDIGEPETIKRCIENPEFAIQDDLALRVLMGALEVRVCA